MKAKTSVEEKLEFMANKAAQQVEDMKKMEKELTLAKRKMEQASREKDIATTELHKSTLMKGKLEELCRELQKQNKAVMEESKRVANDEQAKRSELSKKFQSTIQDISVKLEEQGEERIKQYKENDALREKLKHFAEQFELREKQMEHQLKTKDLENQLAEAKFKQQAEIANQEGLKAQAYKDQAESLAKTEQELRAQLSVYSEKFEQFQETLTKSNDVFGTFRKEMDKNNKTIQKLQKENLSLKKKCEKSDVTIIQMLEEQKKEKEASAKQFAANEKLKQLCRTLQDERNVHREQIKALGAEPTGLPKVEGEKENVAPVSETAPVEDAAA